MPKQRRRVTKPVSEAGRKLQPPVHLTDPLRNLPVPDADCSDCVAWVRRRDEARARGDFMAAGMATVELKVHLGEQKCGRR